MGSTASLQRRRRGADRATVRGEAYDAGFIGVEHSKPSASRNYGDGRDAIGRWNLRGTDRNRHGKNVLGLDATGQVPRNERLALTCAGRVKQLCQGAVIALSVAVCSRKPPFLKPDSDVTNTFMDPTVLPSRALIMTRLNWGYAMQTMIMIISMTIMSSKRVNPCCRFIT